MGMYEAMSFYDINFDSQRYFRERLYHGDLDGQVFAWDLPD